MVSGTDRDDADCDGSLLTEGSGACPRLLPTPGPAAWWVNDQGGDNTELHEWEKTRIHKNSKMFISLEKKVRARDKK